MSALKIKIPTRLNKKLKDTIYKTLVENAILSAQHFLDVSPVFFRE
jgi:hypothetical protein